MARNDARPQNDAVLLKRIDELNAQLAQAKRQLHHEAEVNRGAIARRRRLRKIEPEFWGAVNIQRSPYCCNCTPADPHRKLWVNGKLHCPFTVICKLGILELRGMGSVPIQQIITLSKL